MSAIILVSSLTFVVHFIGTIAYSPRLAGVLSGRLSLSASMSNILNIISRSAGVLIIPVLSKKIETALLSNARLSVPDDYIFIFIFALLGSIAGFFCFKSAVKILYYTVMAYTPSANILYLLFRSLVAFNINKNVNPGIQHVVLIASNYKYLLINCVVTCIYTSATLAAVYSAYVMPQFRVTTLSFAFIINGAATFLFVTMIDPYISSLTDAAMADKNLIPSFNFHLRCFIYSRITGVIFSIFTFHFFLFVITRCIGMFNQMPV